MGYCTHPTEHKEVDDQPLAWLPDGGHLADGFVLDSWLLKSQEPFHASAIKKRREILTNT